LGLFTINGFSCKDADVKQAMQRARATLADARRAISDLRDTSSSPVDLLDTIQNEVNRFTHTTGIPCELKLCEPNLLSNDIAENASRAVSEGLMNIAKYAQATAVEISMTCEEDFLDIEIEDNGIGFNPKDSIGRSGHYGLLGIRERARILGGSLTIESDPTLGTTLKIRLPLEKEI